MREVYVEEETFPALMTSMARAETIGNKELVLAVVPIQLWSPYSCSVPKLWPSSTAFCGHKQRSGM